MKPASRRADLPHFVPILGAISLTFLLDGNLESNELDTLALALHHLRPSFIAGDFRLSLPPGARLPFQVVLTPLLLALPLPAVSIVGRLGLYALLAGALGRLAAKLDMDRTEALIVGVLYTLLGQQIVAGEFVIGGVESKSLAYAAVLWGLDFALGRRWARAGVAMGLAFTFHPLVGLWSTVAAALALWRAPRDAWARAVPAFLLAAAPGLALVLPLLGPTAPSTVDGRWIYVYFRHPHHLDPSWFLKEREPALRLAAALALAVGSLRVRFATEAQRTMARFGRATLAIFVLGLAASCLPRAERFLVTYPFRVGDTLFPLIGLSLAVRRVFQRRTSGLAGATKVAATAGAATLCLVALRHDLEERSEWKEAPVHAAYAWVRDHTPADAVVLCSPARDLAGILMRRVTVASAKGVPTAPADVAAWYLRLVDLNGGKPPRQRGFAAFDELDDGFEALSPAEIDALAAKYHASYLLRHSWHPLPYEAQYDDGEWAIYRLRAP